MWAIFFLHFSKVDRKKLLVFDPKEVIWNKHEHLNKDCYSKPVSGSNSHKLPLY